MLIEKPEGTRILPSIHPSDGSAAQIGPWHPHLMFLNHTELDTQGRTPLDELSARCRDLYLHRTTQHINTSDKLPCPKRDSNPRSQQPSCRRPRAHEIGNNNICKAIFRLENNIKMISKEIRWWCGLDTSGWRQGPVAGSCEHSKGR
jgi:hypothetical protein